MVTNAVSRPQVQRTLESLAHLLDYPDGALTEQLNRAEALLAEAAPEAAEHLTLFREAVDGLSSPRLQEIYTGTFDLDARCHPYIGYQLLGESYKRSQFMLGLKECYREHGVQPPSNELPDHLAVMLRFLAAVPNREISREMVVEALMPALEGMLREAQQEEPPEEAKDAGKSLAKPSPYEMVLRALLGWLRRTYGRAYFEGESRE